MRDVRMHAVRRIGPATLAKSAFVAGVVALALVAVWPASARSQANTDGGAPWLEILPATIDLRGPRADHGLLVTLVAADGTRTDVTHACQFSTSDAQIVTVSPEGHCQAVADGKAEVVAEHEGVSA